ncbi:MAG: NAD(+)/NADH kinase [Bacteriovorax sp.]|nr:NAD(+)/NADH kinase [Bacteriovorax sp.]
MAQLKNISIVLKPKVYSDFESILPNLASWLLRRKKTISFLEKEKERIQKIFKDDIKNLNFIAENDLHTVSDLIITMGGDGTLIGVCRNIKKSSPPIFGVNIGHLGFITEFAKSEFFDQLEATLKGDFKITPLCLYQVEVFSKKKEKPTFKGYFLNDVVVNNNQISRMLTLSVESDGEHIYNLAGDGLIISSPIGSTAYSLAAGGPIIHPLVNAITLTPICAHSLTHRPLVIPDHSNVVIKAARTDESIKLTLDGQQQVTLGPNDIIKVTKKKTKIVHLIKNPNRTYFRTLKDKFTHGAREIK